MDSRQRADLDRHITGNWGEDSVPDDDEAGLPEMVRAVHLARQAQTDAKRRYDALLEVWQQEHSGLSAQIGAYTKAVLVAEEMLRRAAVAHYAATSDKRPTPGVQIKVFETLEYPPDLALDWAIEHKVGLALDKKSFERHVNAESRLPEWVTRQEQPRVQIDADLSKVGVDV